MAGAFAGAGLVHLTVDTSGLGALAVALYGFFGAGGGHGVLVGRTRPLPAAAAAYQVVTVDLATPVT